MGEETGIGVDSWEVGRGPLGSQDGRTRVGFPGQNGLIARPGSATASYGTGSMRSAINSV